jgi:hypothetical protein
MRRGAAEFPEPNTTKTLMFLRNSAAMSGVFLATAAWNRSLARVFASACGQVTFNSAAAALYGCT